MKRCVNLAAIVVILAGVLYGECVKAQTAFSTPKREFRSAWVATVWRLDWPNSPGYTEPAVRAQKGDIDRMLDSLKNNNFNAINFQVRSMCDAMYRSSYEPWSSYLTETRGLDPGWDPLEYVVEACHKRGMECHAWVNPYRFSTNGIDQWNTAYDQELKSSGRLLSWGNTVILDPAQQRNIDLIVDICKEIITKYDVDGILYDDYFYPNGISTGSDAGDYNEWAESGVDMTFADWRRNNVNRMVQAVYNMIQEERPEVRFGISPAGVAGTSSTSAGNYGVTPCPSGGDWQYNGIFSDPLAWLANQSIDYLSPQVYWKIGATADFGKITPWWGQMADHFGRHVYISESISDISGSSDEGDHREIANEVELTRTSNIDGAPGSIFYSAKYLYRMNNPRCELARYLANTTFAYAALPPAMSWKPGTDPGLVSNLQVSDHCLSWTGFDNYKYTVYAIPNSLDDNEFDASVQYLVGMSYDTEYALPEQFRYGYHYAVAPLDRMNNEFTPTIFNTSGLDALAAPALLTPAYGELTDDPCTLSWTAVNGAQAYMVELATDEAMNNIVARKVTAGTEILSTDLGNLQPHDFYWRVRACAEGYADGVSAVSKFIPQVFAITYPAAGATDINPAFTLVWHTAGIQNEATVEIAVDEAFSDIAYSTTSATGEAVIPELVLAAGTKYYLRVRVTTDQGTQRVTPTVIITTSFLIGEVPVFAVPVEGGTLYSDQYLTIQPQAAAQSYTIEISSTKTFGRTRFIETTTNRVNHTTKQASEIKIGSKLLTDGNTYYARALVSYLNEAGDLLRTAYCEPISFVYSSDTEPVAPRGDLNGDGQVNTGDVSALYQALLNGSTDSLYDLNGDGSVNAGDVSTLYGIILEN